MRLVVWRALQSDEPNSRRTRRSLKADHPYTNALRVAAEQLQHSFAMSVIFFTKRARSCEFAEPLSSSR
jgi:hypothetical protein